MNIDPLSVTGTSTLTPRQQRNHQVQNVFSAVLEEVGREGYASAEALTDEQPMTEQIVTSWSDWFDGERRDGRFAQATEAESLKRTYGNILARAYEKGGYAEPQGFLARLSEEELAVVQRVHSLADEIQVESLSDEGAMNLLLPSAAQVDLNHDGLTRSGRAYGIRFPDSSTPPKVVSAWEQVTAGMHWSERINYEIQMLMPLLTANLVSDESGQFLYAREPGDPDFVNPLASADYSYVQATQDRLDYLNDFRARISSDRYDRDTDFWTSFQQQLIENGAT
jgi:hypothetical protein